MKTKVWLFRGLIIVLVTFVVYLVVSVSVRLWLFSNWQEVYDEWNDLLNEYSDDFPEERFPFPVNYHMNSIFEVYAVKQFRIRDDSNTITEKELYKQFEQFVDAANERLDGNQTKIYIGHSTLDNISPKYFFACLFDVFSDEKELDENVWYVVMYKRAKKPFKLCRLHGKFVVYK